MKQRPLYLLPPEPIFPPVEWARPDGLLAVGGDLSPERLLHAYESAIFPWPLGSSDPATPLLWFSPPQRAVIEPAALYVGRSLRKVLRRGELTVRFDSDFAAVIRACADTPRPGQPGTWITDDMIAAYCRLHQLGYAHSVESYQDGQLCGGLYGVSLGGCFFGESMFSHRDDASKIAFVSLCEQLASWQFDLVDCQVLNQHLLRFGVYQLARPLFVERLRQSLLRPTRRGSWSLAPPVAT
jgi:leucyl/phenylalanyl-tRNA--protein transferase